MTKARHLSAGPSCDEAVSGLAEDAVHLGAAHRAGALCHATSRVTDSNLPVERPLLLALHAVALVALGHGSSLGRSPSVPGRPRCQRYPAEREEPRKLSVWMTRYRPIHDRKPPSRHPA